MNYLIIRFPFSSVNDEQYMLAVCLHNPVTLQPVMDVLNADSQVFTPGLSYTDGPDTIYNYTGTLQGSVQVVDDERDDFYEPIVASKLTFNMACETFPEWLMQYCDMRWASVILYKDNEKNVELFRGYLVAQSLNMTVVRDKLACSMVAVDEIGMAKYMPLNKTLSANIHSLSISTLMEYFHDFHFYQGFTLNGINGIGFDRYYQLFGLTPSNMMLWHSNMALLDDYDAELDDLPSELIVNLDKWLIDDKATWHDVFDAIYRYLGVTLCMGGWNGLGANDAYLLSCPTDAGTIKQYEYSFGSGSQEITGSQFAVLNNPFKIGGDLQVTVEPNRYKSVTVSSEPRRWGKHEYLTDEHYKEVSKGAQIRYTWGVTENDQDGPFETYGWHKMIYIKPDTEEAKYLDIAPCQNGEGYIMARNGELPYVDLSSCDNKDEPDASVANTLDFITFKEGVCVVKIGSGKVGGIDENKQLTPYFLIMNHMWGNMLNKMSPHVMQTTHIADTTWMTLKPFASQSPIHPSEKHFLKIGFKLMFIRENMGTHNGGIGREVFLYFPSQGVGQAMGQVNFSQPAILLPCEESEYQDFANPNAAINGIVNYGNLYFTAYIRIGDFYYNGSSWIKVNVGDTPPKCNVTLWNENNTAVADKFGIFDISSSDYYYTISSPHKSDNSVDRYNDTKMMVNIGNLSIHNQPLEGRLEMQILGQVKFQSTSDGAGNSVPFILLKDVDIAYTDDAEMIGKDIANKATVYMDAYSQTKQEMERELEIASPTVDGFFDNAMVYDGGKVIHNVTTVVTQGGRAERKPEELLANMLAQQYSNGQCFVELSTPIRYDDNIHNVGFVVKSLTEVDGKFLPVKRTFDYRMERMRVKLQRINVAAND